MQPGRLVPLLLAAGLTPAQNAPDARALLDQSRDALRAFESYQLDQRLVVEIKGDTVSRLEMPVKVAASRPGKMRIESNGQLGSMLIVSDGENTWMYVGPVKQYTRTPAASSPEALIKSLNPGIGQMVESLKSKDPYLAAKITGEEPLEVAGKKFDCYVVEAALDKIVIPGSTSFSDGVLRTWIDKQSMLTLKQTMTASMQGGPLPGPAQVNQSTTVVSFQLNQPLPDSLFRFTPPEGATQVAEFKGPVKATADLTGKAAPDFKLKSVDGADFSLAALRGKVVLLDFWATWCVPCRRDLPALEQIDRDFRDQGLVLLGIDVDETKDAVTKFLLQNKLSYPVLLNSGSSIAESYSVTAFPTLVLIDREGKIALYHVGAGGEKDLRAGLAKLLLAPPK